MGSPVQTKPVAYLCGKAYVYFVDLTVKERVEFVDWVVETLRDHLHFFSAFKPINEEFKSHRDWGGHTYWVVDLRVDAPGGFKDTTKCLELCLLSHNIRGYAGIVGPRQKTVQFKKLLLTRNGKFVVWNADYQLLPKAAAPDRPLENRTYKATRNEFKYASKRQLIEILADSGYCKQILASLQQTTDMAIEEREERLQLIRRDADAVTNAIRQLVMPD